ncbi:MAG: response regulator [Thermodesulfobacteriota bacterium]|nr:response regulator [Thermodesulfobacteriota bacterium]
MKKVLIVDDDSVSRGLLSRVMKPYAKDFEILTAKNGEEAANMMTESSIDLIISDLQMPVMDGFQLLEYIEQNYPGTPVFLMTAFGSAETEEKAYALGAFKYFEKPLNMDVLTDAIFEQLNSGAEGKINGISLASFLQLMEMEKKTCTLRITTEDHTGNMYFREGQLINAATDQLKSLEAAFEMLTWDQITIEIEGICRKKEKEIKQPLMNILMEGLKIRDEKESEKKEAKTALRPLTDFSARRNTRKLK